MSEPIIVYTPEGERLIMHSPNFVKEQVKEKKFYLLSPVSLTVTLDLVDEGAVASIASILGVEEDEEE
jgi:hypothetical protein